MPSVSRTLWSVMSTPMPRSLRNLMMRWMSSTAIGSTPAKGSSSRMNAGRVPSARDLQPPPLASRQRDRGVLAQVRDVEILEQLGEARLDLPGLEALELQDRLHVLLDCQAA